MGQKNLTYYQPSAVKGGELPEELASFMAFETRRDCEEWLEDNGYDVDEYAISEYHGDDIEDVTLVDADGYFVDGTGSVSAYNTGNDLDEAQDWLQETIGDALELSGPDADSVTFDSPVLLCSNKSDILENHGLNPDLTDDDRNARVEIERVDRAYAYGTDGTAYPLWDIVDIDDIERLRFAVEESE